MSPDSYSKVIITFNKDLDLNESKLCNNNDIQNKLGGIFTLMKGSVSQDLSANFIGKNFKKLDSKKIQINLYVKPGVWDYDIMTLRLKPEAYVDQYGNFGNTLYKTNEFVIDTTNTTVNISITDGSDNPIDTITKMNFETGLKIRLDMSQNEVPTAPHKDGSGNWELRFQKVKRDPPQYQYVAGGKIANTNNPSYDIELPGEDVKRLVSGLTPTEYKFIIYTTNIAENMMTTEQSINVNLVDIYHINKIEVDNNKNYGDGQIIITTGGMNETEIKGMYVVFTANPLTGTGESFKYYYDDAAFKIKTMSVTKKKVIINLPNDIRYKICKFQTKKSQFQPLLVSAGFTGFEIKAYQTYAGLNHPHNFLPWIVCFGVKILKKHGDTASKPGYTWKELAFAMDTIDSSTPNPAQVGPVTDGLCAVVIGDFKNRKAQIPTQGGFYIREIIETKAYAKLSSEWTTMENKSYTYWINFDGQTAQPKPDNDVEFSASGHWYETRKGGPIKAPPKLPDYPAYMEDAPSLYKGDGIKLICFDLKTMPLDNPHFAMTGPIGPNFTCSIKDNGDTGNLGIKEFKRSFNPMLKSFKISRDPSLITATDEWNMYFDIKLSNSGYNIVDSSTKVDQSWEIDIKCAGNDGKPIEWKFTGKGDISNNTSGNTITFAQWKKMLFYKIIPATRGKDSVRIGNEVTGGASLAVFKQEVINNGLPGFDEKTEKEAVKEKSKKFKGYTLKCIEPDCRTSGSADNFYFAPKIYYVQFPPFTVVLKNTDSVQNEYVNQTNTWNDVIRDAPSSSSS